MTEYCMIAIPEATAEAVRTTLASPGYGHPAHVEVAQGYGPCRLCLRFFEVGEERRILFTHDPFFGTDRPPLPGPVFIHEQRCEPYPADAGFPGHLLEHPLTLTAYGPDRRVIAEVDVVGGEIEPRLRELFDRPGVEDVHVRDTGAGCYDLRIERS